MRHVTIKMLLAAAMLGGAAPAMASGFLAEANVARTYGDWGGEVGLGYRYSFTQFDITAGGGAEVSDTNGSNARAYARAEAGVSIPLLARVGVGARYLRGDVRPYGTVSTSFIPFFSIKVNAGPKYVAGGLTFGF